MSAPSTAVVALFSFHSKRNNGRYSLAYDVATDRFCLEATSPSGGSSKAWFSPADLVRLAAELRGERPARLVMHYHASSTAVAASINGTTGNTTLGAESVADLTARAARHELHPAMLKWQALQRTG